MYYDEIDADDEHYGVDCDWIPDGYDGSWKWYHYVIAAFLVGIIIWLFIQP